MSLTKVTYVDGRTVIYAQNLNDIQDEIIAHGTSLGTKAPLDSPPLTGTPTAPTATESTDNTQIATTEFANRAALSAAANKQGKINASGLLKGDGSGGVSAAVAGTDYETPTGAKTLGLTGASVGDLVRVAAVDTNGKPTSWAPVRFVNTHLRKWDVATCGKIVFVGNSYAKDSTAWAKWPDVAAQTLGLGAEGINWWNIGHPGSSMTTDSVDYPSFLTLISTWVSGHADEINNVGAVVCVAGLNDSNVNNVPLLPAAITTLSNYVRSTFSHAKMYFGYTGFLNQQVNKSKPPAQQSPATDEYIRLALLAYTNCIKDGALYLGGVENVIHQKSLLDTDGIHPNQEGAAQLGRAVANALLQGYAPHQSTETAAVTYEREYGFTYGNIVQSSVNGIQSTVINLGFQFYDNPQPEQNPDFSHCPTWTAGDVFTAGKLIPPFTNGLEATDILMSVYALNVGSILCNCRVAVDKETNELKFRIGAFSNGGSSFQIAQVSSFSLSSSAPLFKDLYTVV